MSAKTDSFINALAPVVQEIYKSRKTVLPSVCLAQAALESGWNINASTLFGIKGTGVVSETKEYVDGQWITVQASFRQYPNITAAVVGYYNLMSNTRYQGVSAYSTPEAQIEFIWKAGYATDPDYVSKIVSIINGYNLAQYDTVTSLKSIDDVAQEVIRGEWGDGSDRKARLEAAGYNYDEVQGKVNELMGASAAPAAPAKSIDDVAQEVIRGEWGDGSDRKARLEAAGYNYSEVQNKVNELMGVSTTPTKSIDDVAWEVIRGEWGNGSERKAKLEAAGYNYSEVQGKVNELL